MKIKIIISVLLLSVCGCSGAAESTFVIQGGEYSYAIPTSFLKSNSSILYSEGGELGGDSGVVYSLIIPAETVGLTNADSVEVSLLIFSDKYYEHQSLKDFAVKMVSDDGVSKIDNPSKYFVYQYQLGSFSRNYFMTFDPYSSQILLGNSDFFVNLVQAKSPYEVAGKLFIPKVSCAIHTRLDGFALQISGTGDICQDNNFRVVVTSIDELFSEWNKTEH